MPDVLGRMRCPQRALVSWSERELKGVDDTARCTGSGSVTVKNDHTLTVQCSKCGPVDCARAIWERFVG